MKSVLLKKALTALLAIAMLFAAVACAGKSEPAASKDAPKDTLAFGVAREPSGLDPHQLAETIAFNVTCAIYDNIVKENDAGEYVPSLADSVSISDDGLVYTVKYTKDIKFSNGEPLTVEDFKFSIDRTTEKAWGFDMTRYISSVEVQDSETLIITLNAPFNGFLGSLASPYFSIMSKKYVEEVGDDVIKRQPMGTGPYVLTDWVSGDHLELTANESYFGEEPAIKKITYKVVSDKNTGIMALESGELDVYDDVDVNDIEMVKENKDLQFQSSAKAGVYTLCMNNEVAPLDDIRVREAISYALNRDNIITGVFRGYGEVANSPIPPNCAGYSTNVKQHPHDPEKARQLLADAGYTDGLDLKISIQAPYRAVAEVIQGNFSEVGINLDIDILEASAFSTNVYSEGNYQLCIRGWIAMFPDAYSILYCQYHEDCYGPTGNISHLRDAELNRLLDEAALSTSDNKVAAYDAVVKQITDNSFEMPLIVIQNFVAARADLQGLSVPPVGIYDFTKLHY